MSYAELFGIQERRSDWQVMKMLAETGEIQTDDAIVSKAHLTEDGVTGDFGEVMNR